MYIPRRPCSLCHGVPQRPRTTYVITQSSFRCKVASTSTKAPSGRRSRKELLREGPKVRRVTPKDALLKDIPPSAPLQVGSSKDELPKNGRHVALGAKVRSGSKRLAPGSGPQRHNKSRVESVPLSNIDPSHLQTYHVNNPPTRAQLRQARDFFQRRDPIRLWRVSRFMAFPPKAWPEVAMIGRSNVGKSSLINAVLDEDVHRVATISSKPGRTRTMNGYGVGGVLPKPKKGHSKAEKQRWEYYIPGPRTLVVVDLPGYGGGSRVEWGEEIMKYFTKRQQLRKTYVLIDAEHGLKSSDIELVMYFRQHGLPYQLILNKVDKLLPKVKDSKKLPRSPWLLSDDPERVQNAQARIVEQLNSAAQERGTRADIREDIICCCADNNARWKWAIGLDDLRWSILTVCGLEEHRKGSLESISLSAAPRDQQNASAEEDKK